MMWKRTDDKHGFEPTVEITCRFCGATMALRYSMIAPILETKGFACNLHYKCPECSWVAIFGVPIDKGYYDRLWELRSGAEFLPIDDWHNDEKISKRLAEIGYW